MKKIILTNLFIFNCLIAQNFSINEQNYIPTYYPILLKNLYSPSNKNIHIATENLYGIKQLNIQKIKLNLNKFHFSGGLINYKLYSEISIKNSYYINIKHTNILINPILYAYMQKFTNFYTSYYFLPTLNINYNYKTFIFDYCINKNNLNIGFLYFNKYISNSINTQYNSNINNIDFIYFSLIQVNNNLKLSITYYLNQNSLSTTYYIKLKKYFITIRIKYHPYLPTTKLIEIGRSL